MDAILNTLGKIIPKRRNIKKIKLLNHTKAGKPASTEYKMLYFYSVLAGQNPFTILIYLVFQVYLL